MGQIHYLSYSDSTSILDVQDCNSSFARASLKVLYLGENRNGSRINKESVVKALPSLKNVPIVCHWDLEAGEIGGHDIDIVKGENGTPRIRNLTEPCGVVPESATTEFVFDTDDSGVEHEYLVIHNVLLWKRQDVYNHIVNDLGGKVNHSMEITVNSGEIDSSGYFNIRDFEFTALCLLESCEPCFQGSVLELYAASNFRMKMGEMLADLKHSFDSVNIPNGIDDTTKQSNFTEGGEIALDNVTNIPNEQIAESVAEEVTEVYEPVADAAETEATTDTYALTNNIINEICRILEAETIDSCIGELCRYIYVDCDLDKSEVYCYDVNDWLLYGFPFALDGDAITIDYNGRARKKFVIADFEGDEQPSKLAQIFSAFNDKIQSFESADSDSAQVIESLSAEVETLREFKRATEKQIAFEAKANIISKFADLTGVDEFEALCSNCDALDPEALEEKLYAMRGRRVAVEKFTVDPSHIKIAVDAADPESENTGRYGDLFEKYNRKN